MSFEDITKVLERLGADMRPDNALAVFGNERIPTEYETWPAQAWQPKDKDGRITGQALRDFDSKNIYVALSSFGPWTDNGNTQKPVHGRFIRRTITNQTQFRCFMADDLGTGPGACTVDGLSKTKYTTIEALPIQPSWVVETSADCFQAWFHLSQPVDDSLIAKRAQAEIIEFGINLHDKGGGSRDLNRFGRLPGGINSKRGFTVRRVGEWGPSYTLSELCAAFGAPDPWRPIERPDERVCQPIETVPVKFRMIPSLLKAAGMVLTDHGEKIDILCPWRSEHSGRSNTGAAYFQPNPGNKNLGGFVCHHSSCKGIRKIDDLARFTDEIYTRAQLTRHLQAQGAGDET